MVKFLGSLSLIGLGIFVTLTPKFSGRGGTTDLSYMNLNIFVGFALVSFGILLFRSEKKKK
ncbi:MAG: hypothetical protein COA44_02215 [Arcobacter sp.]|nr:MAG: hypothetical protein COA44_02215 [Arcobacter sp.]